MSHSSCNNSCNHGTPYDFSFSQFEQFSRTVGNAAVEQQRDMQDSLRSFADLYSQSAYVVNATWPLFVLPNFEIHANAVRKQAGLEILYIINRFKDKDVAAALDYVNKSYEGWVYESHMRRYGNLDRLLPVGYHPYLTILTQEGLVPDTVQRDEHYSSVAYSPRKTDTRFAVASWLMS
jgi:hypothetical protein